MASTVRIDAAKLRKEKERGSMEDRAPDWSLWNEWRMSDSAGNCHICTLPIYGGLAYDHLVPKRAGGGHYTHNVRPVHRVCNGRRGDGRIGAQLPLIPWYETFYDDRFL